VTGGVDLVVGRVGPARGVRGEVFVRPWTDDPQARFAPGSVLRTDPDERGPLTVAVASFAGAKLVVRFEGVEDRSAAEALRGTQLLISAADRPVLEDPDEFYDSDLVGLAARTVDGADLGAVREVVHAGGADYLVVTVDGADRLIPFVAAIVPRVDVAAGVVEINPPEGLLEL
jgi:16S rRNA processing protein RimM